MHLVLASSQVQCRNPFSHGQDLFRHIGKTCLHTFDDGELTTFGSEGGILSCYIPPTLRAL